MKINTTRCPHDHITGFAGTDQVMICTQTVDPIQKTEETTWVYLTKDEAAQIGQWLLDWSKT